MANMPKTVMAPQFVNLLKRTSAGRAIIGTGQVYTPIRSISEQTGKVLTTVRRVPTSFAGSKITYQGLKPSTESALRQPYLQKPQQIRASEAGGGLVSTGFAIPQGEMPIQPNVDAYANQIDESKGGQGLLGGLAIGQALTSLDWGGIASGIGGMLGIGGKRGAGGGGGRRRRGANYWRNKYEAAYWKNKYYKTLYGHHP